MPLARVAAIIFDPIGCFADAPDSDCPFDDVCSAMAELKALGVRLLVASSLPHDATLRFLTTHGLDSLVDDVASDDATVAIETLVDRSAFDRTEVLFVTPHADGLHAAKRTGVHGILMMNDPDEAMRLTSLLPAGGVVSLHELPDFVRFVSAGGFA